MKILLLQKYFIYYKNNNSELLVVTPPVLIMFAVTVFRMDDCHFLFLKSLLNSHHYNIPTTLCFTKN